MAADKAEDEVTAGFLVIGDEILSGRTKDKNIGFLADYLTAIGIDLCEVRIVPDVTERIVEASTRCAPRYTYVFTSGGIGPTHDDITADSIAEAFGVGIDVDPRARAILEAHFPTGQLNPARLRMARIPDGADLIENAVSKAPGFRIENVHVMAGVPSIMQAMLDAIAPTLKTGRKMLSRTIDADLPESRVAERLRDIQDAFPKNADRFLSADDRRTFHHPDRRPLAGRSHYEPGSRCRGGRGPQGSRAIVEGKPMESNQQNKAFPVSWDMFHRDARALAWRLSGQGDWKAIVCITVAAWYRRPSSPANSASAPSKPCASPRITTTKTRANSR